MQGHSTPPKGCNMQHVNYHAILPFFVLYLLFACVLHFIRLVFAVNRQAVALYLRKQHVLTEIERFRSQGGWWSKLKRL